MYCKNCGKELVGNTEICINCGFRSCNGDKFCSHCGKDVLPGQSLCINCGFVLDGPKEATKIEKAEPKSQAGNYKKYTKKVKKTKKLALILHVLSLTIVLSLLFLPIYKYEFTPESLEDAFELFEGVENFEDLEKLLNSDGKIERNFSLIDDIKIILSGFTAKDADPRAGMLNLLLGMMAIFEVIFAIILICTTIPQALKTIKDLKNPDKCTLLLFNEIKKSGTTNKKESIFKKQAVITLVMYAVFDVLFAPIEGTMFASSGINMTVRHMCNFSGISAFAYVVIILFVGYIVVSSMKNREEKSMLEQITQEEYKIQA